MTEEVRLLIEQSRQKKVNDEFVGHLKFESPDWKFQYREDYNSNFIPASNYSQNGIVIVLESPHIEEFKNVYLTQNGSIDKITSRPLNNNKTRNHLESILNTRFKEHLKSKGLLDQNTEYSILLVNSIQYQCSLGVHTNEYRDKLFLWNWIELKRNFIERIKNINPVFIFNCCTKGSSYTEGKTYFTKDRINSLGLDFSSKDIKFDVMARSDQEDFTLKDLVERELEKNDLIENSKYIKYDHPSSYNYGKKEYRNLQKNDEINLSRKLLLISEL